MSNSLQEDRKTLWLMFYAQRFFSACKGVIPNKPGEYPIVFDLPGSLFVVRASEWRFRCVSPIGRSCAQSFRIDLYGVFIAIPAPLPQNTGNG